MIRCFMSDNTQWVLNLDAGTYTRTPRDPDYIHPGVSYSKRSGGLLEKYILWTKVQMVSSESGQPVENIVHRSITKGSKVMNDDELYLYVQEPSGYWIETIVKEVFP